jgi:hypothetical protein
MSNSIVGVNHVSKSYRRDSVKIPVLENLNLKGELI